MARDAIEGFLVVSAMLEQIISECLFLYSSIQEILSIYFVQGTLLVQFYSFKLCLCKYISAFT